MFGFVGNMFFVVVKRRRVLSASFSTATTVHLSICVQFCLIIIIIIIIAELFNHSQRNQGMVIYFNQFCC